LSYIGGIKTIILALNLIPETLLKQLNFYDMFLLTIYLTVIFALFGISIRENTREKLFKDYKFKKKLKKVLKALDNMEKEE